MIAGDATDAGLMNRLVAEEAPDILILNAGCAYRKSNPAILMVQSAQDRMADNASGCLGGT
jgi:hypothetical protein